MDDFREFAKKPKEDIKNGNNGQNIADMVKNIAGQFDGKSQNDLLKAIYDQALKGKKNGTLTNQELDGFANMLSPMLDGKKREYLHKIVEQLKKL